MQYDLAEGQRTAAEKTELRKDQSPIRNRDACAEQKRPGTENQTQCGHWQGPQAAENEKDAVLQWRTHGASVHKIGAHEKAGRSPLFLFLCDR